jgi:hypothetical protein
MVIFLLKALGIEPDGSLGKTVKDGLTTLCACLEIKTGNDFFLRQLTNDFQQPPVRTEGLA